jgi:hypothetical protein
MTLVHTTIPQQAEISPQLYRVYLFEKATPRSRYSYSESDRPGPAPAAGDMSLN